MQDVIVGVLAIAVGAFFCLRGYLAMRMLIPAWGAFTGFLFGAGFVAGVTDDGFLRSLTAWLLAVGLALLFGLVAYLYYEVCVLLAMAGIGFTLGTSAMVALGVSWSWLIAVVGVVLGALLAFIAIAGDLPTVILFLLTAMAGASAVVFGLMLVSGAVDTIDLDSASTTQRLDDDWWWYVIYLALAAAGIVTQIRYEQQRRGSLRQRWSDAGGRQLRPS